MIGLAARFGVLFREDWRSKIVKVGIYLAREHLEVAAAACLLIWCTRFARFSAKALYLYVQISRHHVYMR